tara:strand:- start:926 stop:1972 length:1047 start_codon:yes stop_codon:yes gene_type:complete
MDVPKLEILGVNPPESEIGNHILLVAQASYHLGELIPLQDELQKRGLQSLLVAPSIPKKILQRWRPSFARREELRRKFSTNKPSLYDESLLKTVKGVVVMNDWGTTLPTIDWAHSNSIPTFGWVEGAQDFLDADTGRIRSPYKRAEHIFCIGPYDFNALSGCNRTLVGSTRLRSIKATPLPSDAELKVIVNLNFTYGVNSNARQSWIKGVSKAVKQSGHDLTISRHVAEPSLRLPWIEQSEPIESLFSHASYFVTRFSTLCYEALLRGVPMIYHNPHNEKAKNFLDPMGAYPVTTNVYELYEELKERPLERLNIRKQAEEFLNNHLHLISEASPAELAADVICSTASS